jgi:hypothetical protein
VFHPNKKRAEHGVKALDGADGDAANDKPRQKVEGRIKK